MSHITGQKLCFMCHVSFFILLIFFLTKFSLGPFFFILYINDIKDGLESELLIFADDTTLIATGRPDPALTTAQITRNLAK